MIYTTLLLIGIIGLFAQAVFGLGHGYGVHHAGPHSHAGGPGAPGHSHAGGPGAPGHSHAAGPGAHAHNPQARVQTEMHGGHGLSRIWTLLSPLTLFSLCLGIGASGLLIAPRHWTSALTALVAAVGGIAFYSLAVRPLWGLVFSFASTPGRALEGAIATQAEALSRFDAQGRGMVRLHIDGQLVRVLAFLDEQDLAGTVRPGEKLLVVSVDQHANTCRVARF